MKTHLLQSVVSFAPLSISGFALLALACGKPAAPATTSSPAASATPAVASGWLSGPAAAAPSATPAQVTHDGLAFDGHAPPATFEGEISVAVSGDATKKLPATLTYEAKGDKVRVTPSGSKVHTIGDLDGERVWAVDDARKRFEGLDLYPAAAAAPANPPSVQRTGHTEKVAGLDCEDWTVTEGTERVDVCAWKGAAYVDLAPDANAGSSEAGWAAELTAAHAFPLRVVVHDAAGKQLYRAEATKVTPMKVDDAAFGVPTAYRSEDITGEVRMASLP